MAPTFPLLHRLVAVSLAACTALAVVFLPPIIFIHEAVAIELTCIGAHAIPKLISRVAMVTEVFLEFRAVLAEGFLQIWVPIMVAFAIEN